MVALSFAAAVTSTLRIGMLVLGNDYKHPAVVAKEAATLDVLSDGRLEFGLGAGWMTADYAALGLPLRRAGHTYRSDWPKRWRWSRGAWGDGPFEFAGEHYTITGYDGLPKPRPAAAPADHHRRRRTEDAAARRARGRHRGDQPDPASWRDRRRRRARHARRRDRAQGRLGPRGRGGSVRRASSCRSGTSSPRSPTIAEGSPRPWPPAFGVDARRGARLGGRAGGVGRGGVRNPDRPPRGVGRVVRRAGGRHYEAFAPVVGRLAGT